MSPTPPGRIGWTAVLSLVATPLLVWVSTAHTLYFDNQDDLGRPLSLLAPFWGCSLATLALGVGLLYFQNRRGIRWLLWAYYLFGPLFLLLSPLRNVLDSLPHPDRIHALVVIPYLGVVLVLNRRYLPIAAVRPFAFVSALFLVGELYAAVTRYAPDETDAAGQTPIQSPIAAVSRSDARTDGAGAHRPNIYHLLFDSYQTDVFMQSLTPEVQKALGGFVFFPNNTALFSLTRMSLPSIFSGKTFDFSESPERYQREAFQSPDSFLHGLKSRGYQTLGYTRKIYSFRLSLFDRMISHTENIADHQNEVPGNRRVFFGLWCWTYLPRAIAQWLIGSEQIVQIKGGMLLPASAPVESYLSFLAMMDQEESLPPVNRYTFAHLMIPHEPYVYRSDCTYEGQHTSGEEHGACVVRLILRFVDRLKRLGRYDDAMIIIHGDHGARLRLEGGRWVDHPVRSPRATLLIKPFTRGEAVPFEVSDQPTTLLDISPTLLHAVGTSDRFERGVLLAENVPYVPLSERFYYVFEESKRFVRYRIENHQLGRQDLGSFAYSSEKDVLQTGVVPLFLPDQVVEAEAGYLNDAVDRLANLPDVSGQYVIHGDLAFRFKISKTGRYQLHARVIAPSYSNDFCSLQMGEGASQPWTMKVVRQWQWIEAPFQWTLPAGEHLLRIRYGEPVYFDQIQLKRVETAT